MSIFKSITDFFVEALTPDVVKKRLAQRLPMNVDQRWALASGAQLTALNQGSNDTLTPDPTRDSNAWQSALITWWSVTDRAELLEMLRFLNDSGHRVKFRERLVAELLAWDLVRLVNVARWGYGARYLSEEEAWTHILAAASQFHARYGSRSELGADYIAGHDVWAEESDPKLVRATTRLLAPDNAGSPWNQLAWNAFGSAQ